MPHEIISRSRIEREAIAAAKTYSDINAACPYPFRSEAGKAFKDEFIKARMAIEDESASTESRPTTRVKNPVTRHTRITLHPVLAERASQLAKLQESLGQEPGKTPSITIHPASTTTGYDGAELTAPAVRALADTPQGIPSRTGDRLHYRCGRVTDLHGNPITTTGV